MEQTKDFIATELLSELKQENARKDSQIKRLQYILLGAFCCMLALVGMFIWYLNQYDFTSTKTTTQIAEGVYALVDSEGNTIAWDITPEEAQALMEIIANGEGVENANTN